MVHGICEIISTGNSKTHFLEREKKTTFGMNILIMFELDLLYELKTMIN